MAPGIWPAPKHQSVASENCLTPCSLSSACPLCLWTCAQTSSSLPQCPSHFIWRNLACITISTHRSPPWGSHLSMSKRPVDLCLVTPGLSGLSLGQAWMLSSFGGTVCSSGPEPHVVVPDTWVKTGRKLGLSHSTGEVRALAEAQVWPLQLISF